MDGRSLRVEVGVMCIPASTSQGVVTGASANAAVHGLVKANSVAAIACFRPPPGTWYGGSLGLRWLWKVPRLKAGTKCIYS